MVVFGIIVLLVATVVAMRLRSPMRWFWVSFVGIIGLVAVIVGIFHIPLQ